MMSRQDDRTLSELLARPKVGIVIRPEVDAAPACRIIDSWAENRNSTVVEFEGTDEPESASECGLVFALGGDGTVLRALAAAAPAGVPVLGVNLGSLGFLTEVSASQLEAALQLIDGGSASLESRLALDVLAVDANRTRRYLAFNDCVLSRTPGGGPAAVAVHVDGAVFARYSCDAIIVATPTGSTAYNYAAGGPLVAPSIDAFAVTAVAPHGPFNRTLLTDASADISIEALARSASLELEVDGHRVSSISAGSGLRIARSETRAVLLRVSPSSYYERVRTRLALADPEVLREERSRTRTILTDVAVRERET